MSVPGNPSAESLRGRVRGVLHGLAAGDRIGGPISMAIRLAESLLHVGHFDPTDIGDRYLDWWKQAGFDTGPTAERVFRLASSGLPFEEASRHVHAQTQGMTAGCNPAHRASPLAMSVHAPDEELAGLAANEARLTHSHPLAGDVSAAVVVLCRQLIRGIAWNDALEAAKQGREEATKTALDAGQDSRLNAGGFAPDVLAAAVYFVGIHESFEDCLETSLKFAGPANYCPVLVGAIAGARWGAASIAERLLQHCKISNNVQDVSDRLADQWQREG